ncbi:MFS family permease [Hamadaea flava]|uniref:MFS transporter n=1 Tax=Hamadaea flava TaxID=1742688 RepID=A0ABV8M1U4_9ACTN|nr:MFS transporter [Hamadaea flava]MCP2326745.1 MFS family permease [Hamadaea flava]
MKALVDIGPLREQRAFRRLWLGATASGFGSNLTTFAVAFSVWDSTHNSFYVGLIGLFAAIPLITLALVGSAFIDHLDRVRLARSTTLGQIATSVLFAAAAAFGQVWAMFALTAVAAGLSAVGSPARRAIVTQMLPADRLAAGLALNHLSFQLSMLLGPALAGVITAAWGSEVCFLLDAATFVAALLGLRGLPPAATAPDGRPGMSAVWEGLRFTIRTPLVRGALLADLSATVLAMPVALFPAINEEKFGGSPRVLGLFLTSVAVGGLIASMLSGLATRGARPGAILLVCGAVWGGALALVGVADHLVVVLALLALAGGADTWAVVSRGTVVQASTPDAYRGRVASLEHIVGVAGPELGGVRAGAVAALTSGGASLLLGGLACLVGIGLIARLNPQLRTGVLPPPQSANAERLSSAGTAAAP